MPSPNQILGRVKITVGGTVVSSKPGAKFMPSPEEREGVVDDSGYAGFTVKNVVQTVEFEVFIKGSMTARQLMALVDDTCLFEGDNGYTATLTLATMASVGEVTVSSSGSTFACKMIGAQVNEATG